MARQILFGLGRRAHLPHHVETELGDLANAVLGPSRVFSVDQLIEGELFDWHRLLRERWSKEEEGRNEGEAACLAIATARGWKLLVDDRVAVGIAVERRIPAMRTANLLLAGARVGWWTVDEGWDFFLEMVAAGRDWLGPRLWNWADKRSFAEAVAAVNL